MQEQHNASGALAFAIFYYKAFDWSLATNDPYLLIEVSLPTCAACTHAITRIEDLIAKHQTLRGGRLTLLSAGLVTGHFRFKSDYVVEAKVRQQSYTVQQPGKVPIPAGKENEDDAYVFVSWVQNGWRIVEVGERS